MESPLIPYDNINILDDPDVIYLLEGKYTAELQFHSTQDIMVIVSSDDDHTAVMLPYHEMVTKPFKDVFIETLKQCISLHKYNFEPAVIIEHDPVVIIEHDPVMYTYDVHITYKGKKHHKKLTQTDLVQADGSFEDIINKLVSNIKKEQKEINHGG